MAGRTGPRTTLPGGMEGRDYGDSGIFVGNSVGSTDILVVQKNICAELEFFLGIPMDSSLLWNLRVRHE